MKKVFCILSAFVLACAALFVPGRAVRAADYLLIKNYDVQISVGEDNVYDITEKITAYFEPEDYRHGIIREIPIRQEMNTPEGTKRYDIIVSGVFVKDQTFKVNRTGNYMNIRIGDPDRYFSGEVTYTIRYLYGIGDDQTDKFDFVYYNIIGTEWNANIEKAAFSVTLPKPFDAEKVWVYSGRYGSTESDVDVSVDGNTIRGILSKALKPNEGVTLKVELPQGYFTAAAPKETAAPYTPDEEAPAEAEPEGDAEEDGVEKRALPPAEPVICIIMGGLALLAVLLFLIFGVDLKTIVTVEFSPPEGMTPAETGYVIDGNVDNRDIVSLILYWADKGFLEILVSKKDEVYLKKLRELPPDARRYESVFFDRIFSGFDLVSVESLQSKLYDAIKRSKAELVRSFGEDAGRRIFTPASLRIQTIIKYMAALPLALAVLYGAYVPSEGIFLPLIAAAAAFCTAYPALNLIAKLLRVWRSLPRNKRAGKLVLRVLFAGGVFCAFFYYMLSFPGLPALAVTAAAASLIIAFTSAFARKRTKKGAEWLGKILGLQRFIEKAEKDRIERLAEEDPGCFYSVLPYAYALGVTEKWAERLKKIGVQLKPPEWYGGDADGFSFIRFTCDIDRSLDYMSKSHAAHAFFNSTGYTGGGGYESYGGGGSGGGGGHSGGGFGGGGGSW